MMVAAPESQAVTIPAGSTAVIAGDLTVPEGARGVVVFAHGSGSGRHSPRNRSVAAVLNRGGMATLLVDLLTDEEERERDLRFDIPLLTERVVAALDWVASRDETRRLAAGCFGASTGAAAAIEAAAARPGQVRAVVSRGGRPDLAGDAALGLLQAPALLIVGSADEPVLELNRRAAERMPGGVRVAVVPGATHLFQEAGALDAVARLALDWFGAHLRPSP